MTKVPFSVFKNAVQTQFDLLGKHELFTTEIDPDTLYENYISSFPIGTNNTFRKRKEYECSACRKFIRDIGNVVAIIDRNLVSIWDITINDSTFQPVADSMAWLVKSRPIRNRFLCTEKTAGNTNKSLEDSPNGIIIWDHLFAHIPCGHDHNEKNFVCKSADLGQLFSESQAHHDVLMRSLVTISLDSIHTVLDLINRNTLYRGDENRHAVEEFLALKLVFDQTEEKERNNFVWEASRKILNGAVTKIRNSAIGTLLVDLSEGMFLEHAVSSFESKVAPANYKRTTALVTTAMVNAARNKIEELGLTSALDRRYATSTDININNLLFAHRHSRQLVTDDVFSSISTTSDSIKSRDFDRVDEIGIGEFISDIVPQISSIDILVESRHVGNFVSLTAPVDPNAKNMFKWNNGFAWSYKGDVTDSVKERVKKAGGNVTGDLCFRLAWYNYDDLDLHMIEPGYEIYFANRQNISPSGGRLDVDMNVTATTREPVENIYYQNESSLREGRYTLFVHNYTRREDKDVGFEVEFDHKGTVRRYVYLNTVRGYGKVTVLTFNYSYRRGVTIESSLPENSTTRTIWGITTERFHPVSIALLSPNYWDGVGIGNKHYFFMLKGCVNDDTSRGFYNEFLKGELEPHRKVLEIVGGTMRIQKTPDQLSGLGFSSTQRGNMVVRVKGEINQTLRVVF